MNKIYFVTGASGAGKTTTVSLLEKEGSFDFGFCYFDSVGVPTSDEMDTKYGGTESWQKLTTSHWVKNIQRELLPTKSAILDGQMRLSFITEACEASNISNYQIILFDCTDEERAKRLLARGHADLANSEMMKWADYLRIEAKKLNAIIIDTTGLTKQESLELLKAALVK